VRGAQKKTWPELKKAWTEFDTRDQVVDFVNRLHERTEIETARLLKWLGLPRSKFYDWRKRYGLANEHNGKVPRDWWLEDWEKQAAVDFFTQHPRDGYRRLAYMMIDADVVACAPSTIYRVLKDAGLLLKSTAAPSKKGAGFVQPEKAHQEWHIDVTYLNLGGTFYYLCSILDGYSRFIVEWEIRESMKEPDVELIVQRALEKFPGVKPKLISDNGPPFIAKDFKEFIRLSGITHVRTSPYYPQSNGKQERMQGTVKRECIREKSPATEEEARRIAGKYVDYYNDERLHSALGYVTPRDMLEGRAEAIQTERERKLAEARERRKANRRAERAA
jgi:transposase InsO family protein